MNGMPLVLVAAVLVVIFPKRDLVALILGVLVIAQRGIHSEGMRSIDRNSPFAEDAGTVAQDLEVGRRASAAIAAQTGIPVLQDKDL